MRLTWQASPRNKISGFWDEQANCRTCSGLTTGITDPPRVSPEARGSRHDETAARAAGHAGRRRLTTKVAARRRLGGGIYYGWGGFERDPESDTRPDQRRRAVRGGMRGERWYPGSGLPIAGLWTEPRRLMPLACVCVVRHRAAEHQDRLPGQLHERHPHLVR